MHHLTMKQLLWHGYLGVSCSVGTVVGADWFQRQMGVVDERAIWMHIAVGGGIGGITGPVMFPIYVFGFLMAS